MTRPFSFAIQFPIIDDSLTLAELRAEASAELIRRAHAHGFALTAPPIISHHPKQRELHALAPIHIPGGITATDRNLIKEGSTWLKA